MAGDSDDRQVLIRGVGETAYTKRSGETPLELALAATQKAASDGGLDVNEIDGLICDPGGVLGDDLISNLGLKDVNYSCTVNMGGASAVAGLAYAVLAIREGLAHNVLLYRARNRSSGTRTNSRPSPLPGQSYRSHLERVYGWNTPAQRYAMLCRRYMSEHGLTRAEMGAVAVTARSYANLNPTAQMYGRPLTMEDYLGSRMIAEPYCLFDCCLETDGACGVIVSQSPAPSAIHPKVAILGVAEGHADPPDDLTNRPDILSIGLRTAAASVWELTHLGPEDMDAVMIYDCFTFQTIHQFEEAGFVPRGEGGAFFASGGAGLTGSLPVNTHGGSLSEGHVGGLNHVIEAVRQLRGCCGARQVTGAKHAAVTGWGDLGDGSIAVLAQR